MKFFKNFLSFKKEIWALIFISFLIFPFYCKAWVLDSFAESVFNALAKVIAMVFIGIGLVLFKITTALLDWILSPSFMPLSYTNVGLSPSDVFYNPVVGVGWPIMRNLGNILIVISLLVIGVATALGIKEYQAQKLLPVLIVAGLLINFSPVICGIVIDASNIVIKNLVKDISFEGWNPFSAFGGGTTSGLTDSIKNFFTDETQTGKFVALAFYLWIGAFAFLIYSAIFFVRYIALWILVIFSPLAFASYILPRTKKEIFDRWWDWFLKWNFIGVVSAFFLYCAHEILLALEEKKAILPTESSEVGREIGPVEVSFFAQFLPYVVVIVFLIIGGVVTIKISAYGAGLVISKAKLGWGMVGGRILQGMRKGMVEGPIRGGRWVGGAVRGRERVMRAEEWARMRAQRVPLLRTWARSPQVVKEARISELKEKYQHLPVEDLERHLQTRPITFGDKMKQVAFVRLLAQKKLNDNMKEKIKEIVERWGTPQDVSTLLKKRPDWAEDFGKTVREAMSAIKPPETPQIQKEAFRNVKVVEELLRDKEKLDEIAKNGTMAQREEIVDTLIKHKKEILGRISDKAKEAIKQMDKDLRWPFKIS